MKLRYRLAAATLAMLLAVSLCACSVFESAVRGTLSASEDSSAESSAKESSEPPSSAQSSADESMSSESSADESAPSESSAPVEHAHLQYGRFQDMPRLQLGEVSEPDDGRYNCGTPEERERWLELLCSERLAGIGVQYNFYFHVPEKDMPVTAAEKILELMISGMPEPMESYDGNIPTGGGNMIAGYDADGKALFSVVENGDFLLIRDYENHRQFILSMESCQEEYLRIDDILGVFYTKLYEPDLYSRDPELYRSSVADIFGDELDEVLPLE